ncbi:hypothetical protein Csa_022824 [Cucumis sativus]|uniref:Uncharacterized protein n=1 Tax=Cucumis sativus TaxID=3659 RepID=A0A0A0LVF8_CUCSA|nr:hypothetical protein Csa_022824 [Cucumis sativus]
MPISLTDTILKIQGLQEQNVEKKSCCEEEDMDDQGASQAQQLSPLWTQRPSHRKKKYGIEQVKAFGDKEFSRTVELEQANKWLRALEKCFRVLQCLEERKIDLAAFLLHRKAED